MPLMERITSGKHRVCRRWRVMFEGSVPKEVPESSCQTVSEGHYLVDIAGQYIKVTDVLPGRTHLACHCLGDDQRFLIPLEGASSVLPSLSRELEILRNGASPYETIEPQAEIEPQESVYGGYEDGGSFG